MSAASHYGSLRLKGGYTPLIPSASTTETKEAKKARREETVRRKAVQEETGLIAMRVFEKLLARESAGGIIDGSSQIEQAGCDVSTEPHCLYELANGAPGHHAVLYRSGICAVLAEISHTNVGTSHLGPTRVGPKRPKSAPKIVPRGGQVGCRPTPVACACTPRTPRLGCALSWALARA